MPLPTSRDVHVDQLLTNISTAYTNQEYIADQIFPLVPVRKQSDKLAAYDQSFWFRDEAKLRAPGTYAEEGGYAVDTSATYFCDRYSFAKGIPDETRDNADAPFELDREATEYVTDKLQMKRERKFATDFFTTSVWGTDKTGGSDFTVWSNYGSSSPLVDVTGYKDTVEALIGREPNKFVIGKQVLVQLQWHPDLIDTIKYTQKGVVTQEMIASLFGFESLLVGRTIYTADKEGTAEGSVTYSRIWGKHGLMLWVPPNPSLRVPAAGYTFVWQRVPAAKQYIVRHRDDRAETDYIEANSYFDQKATATRAGLFLSGAVA